MVDKLSYIIVLIRALRIYQWTKNLLVLAALIFSQELLNLQQAGTAILALLAFCLASSATYLFNDLMDIEQDRAHPEKCKRALPSGALSMEMAWAILVVLLMGAIAIAYGIRFQFMLCILVYMLLTLSYSLGLKNYPIVDVLMVALGFVARAMAGAIALDVPFSNWLVVCTLFLALFLGLSKRRSEMTLLDEDAPNHREVLFHYSVLYLDQLILIVAGCTLITYTIYTCSPEVVQRMDTDKLYITIPFVVYGLFRYLYLVHQKDGGGDPSGTILSDLPLGLTVILWGSTCGLVIYGASIRGLFM